MKIINKIKKWLEGPILYDEYMNNPNITIENLNDYELNDIKKKLDILIKYYNIQDVSEGDKIKHIRKEINILNWYNREDFFPPLTKEEACKINHGENIPLSHIYIKNLPYNIRLQRCLMFYFMNIKQLKNKYNEYFIPYLRNLLYFYDICPTQSELKRFLSGEISFNEIRDIWQEFEESSKSDEDYEKIILNGLI